MEEIKNTKRHAPQVTFSVANGDELAAQMQVAISKRLQTLIRERGLSQNAFAIALGKRPCEITKWLSGHHNFTIRTIAMLSAYFGEPLVIILPEFQTTAWLTSDKNV